VVYVCVCGNVYVLVVCVSGKVGGKVNVLVVYVCVGGMVLVCVLILLLGCGGSCGTG